MKGIIIVEKQQDFDKWIAAQKPEYFKAFPALDTSPAAKDSSMAKTAQVALNNK